MTEPWRFTRPFPRSTKFGACFIATALTLSLGVYHPSIARAQSGPITVDLSVIQDGGASGFGSTSQSGLLVPPKTNPSSELHVAPKNVPKLRAPVERRRTTANTPLSKPAEKPMPVMAEKPTPAAPAPLPVAPVAKAEIAPPPTPAVAPAQKPAPAPVAKAAVSKMPEPKPVPKKVDSAPPPPPQVAVVAEPVAPADQSSIGPEAVEIEPGQAVRIEFAEAETKLPDAMKDALRKIADGVHDKQDLRLQLMAYAGAEGLSASKARRLSLSRALSVRSFLIESGVRSTRIDVRALGNKTSEKPANRVDVNIAKR